MGNDIQKQLRGSHALRCLPTALRRLACGFAPYMLVHCFAAVPTREDRTVFAEMASLYNQDDLDKDELLEERAQDKESVTAKKIKSHMLAKQLIARASAAEKDVTADMQSLEDAASRLAGLDCRLKSEDSLARKIESDAAGKSLGYEEAASGVSDVLRYTLIASSGQYNEQVRTALQKLVATGYRVVKFRNAWGGKFYQGINVQLVSPADVPVELQLHTPQSFSIKQASHGVYEIRRDPQSTPEEVQRATRLSLAYNAQVRKPLGAELIDWPLAS